MQKKKKQKKTKSHMRGGGSVWLLSCYSTISLAVEFSVSFSKGTGNNKEQTLQSAEEDYYPSFLLLNKNVCGRSALFKTLQLR